MEVVQVIREKFHSLQILSQHVKPVCAGIGVCGAQIHRIAAVGNKGSEAFFLKVGPQRLHVLRDHRFCLSAARIPRKPGKGITAEAAHGLSHGCIAIRDRQVTSYMNLHPHAELSRVLWRWYQKPFGL